MTSSPRLDVTYNPVTWDPAVVEVLELLVVLRYLPRSSVEVDEARTERGVESLQGSFI